MKSKHTDILRSGRKSLEVVIPPLYIEFAKSYGVEVSSQKSLSRDDLIELVCKAKSDKKSMDLVIINTLKLVAKCVSNYKMPSEYTGGFSVEDAFQSGVQGIYRAVQDFNPELGYTFSTYCVHWVSCMIRNDFIKENRAIRIPKYTHQSIAVIKQALVYGYKFHTDIELKEFCFEYFMNSTLESRFKYRSGFEHAWTTLHHSTISIFSESSDSEQYNDLVMGELVSGPFDETEESSHEQAVRFIKRLVPILLPIERYIVMRYYGLLGDPKTFNEIGEDLGLSYERVRQILYKVQTQLKDFAISIEDLSRKDIESKVRAIWKHKNTYSTRRKEVIPAELMTQEEYMFCYE